MAVTRAFLPQLRARRGRIVNVSSVGGHMTMPFMAAYTATKHAVESLSDGLRMELAPFGVRVVLVEPGPINTGFNGVSLGFVEGYRQAGSIYGPSLQRADEIARRFESMGAGPEVIARVIHRALRVRRPRARYVAPFSSAVALWFFSRLPTRWTDAAMRRMSFLRDRDFAGVTAPEIAQLGASN
jgi:NAD(P)-dependent dehydrogenase (short-subunit alcohol dehydrogenase family)